MRKLAILLMCVVFTACYLLPALAAEPTGVTGPSQAAPDLMPAVESKPPALPTAVEPKPEKKPALIPPSIVTTPAKPAHTGKIGLVDMTKVASESAPGKAALAEVKTKTEKYQTQIKEKEKQLQKQKAAIESQLPALTPQQREVKGKEFQKKVEEFQKFVQKADADVRARQDELLSKLYQSIAGVSANYGKANGFTAVVMKKEILYMDAGVEIQDLTEEIIKKVNAMKPEKKTGSKKGRKTPSRK